MELATSGGKEESTEADDVRHEPRKEQRIVKWIDCSDDEQEGQETAEEREEREVQEKESLRMEARGEKEIEEA